MAVIRHPSPRDEHAANPPDEADGAPKLAMIGRGLPEVAPQSPGHNRVTVLSSAARTRYAKLLGRLGR